MPHLVAELHKSMYVDDLMSEKPTVPEAKKMKEVAIRIFEDAKLTLHNRERLGLEENDREILICRGGVQVHYPVYLPDKHPYTVKLVEDAHRRT